MLEIDFAGDGGIDITGDMILDKAGDIIGDIIGRGVPGVPRDDATACMAS